MVSTLDFRADDPGSIPDGGAVKVILFFCCFPVLRRALKAVGPVGQEPQLLVFLVLNRYTDLK